MDASGREEAGIRLDCDVLQQVNSDKGLPNLYMPYSQIYD
jgi:hypothetical protein